MSLDDFYTGLAELAANPDLVRRARAGDRSFVNDLDLTGRERERLLGMATDPRMGVLCSLYRSNRLTALVRTVPTVVDALGDRLADALTDFWNCHPRTDMQFRVEAESFCDFIRRRHPDDVELQAVVDRAGEELLVQFGP